MVLVGFFPVDNAFLSTRCALCLGLSSFALTLLTPSSFPFPVVPALRDDMRLSLRYRTRQVDFLSSDVGFSSLRLASGPHSGVL